ncbi:MAG TPA: hypothetical protein VGF65_02980 [Mycobacterium sp.]
MAGKSGGKSMRSGLSKASNAKRNTKSGRAVMGAAQFGVPARKKYRIDDAAHARNALGRVAQHGTPAEKAQVRKRVAAKYPSINVTGISKGKKK